MSERPGQLTVGAPSAIRPSLQVPAARNWHDYSRPAGRPEAPPLGQGRRQTADAPTRSLAPFIGCSENHWTGRAQRSPSHRRQFQPGSLPDHQCSIDCRPKSQVVCTPGGAQPCGQGAWASSGAGCRYAVRAAGAGLRVRRAGCRCGLAGGSRSAVSRNPGASPRVGLRRGGRTRPARCTTATPVPAVARARKRC
jgi:hypothetical protein